MAIDLIRYAFRKTKISADQLTPKGHADTLATTREILYAFGIDTWLATMMTVVCVNLMGVSTSRLMMSQTLEVAHRNLSFGAMTFLFVPFFLTGYNFFCNFFNQGQTLGQKFVGIRVDIPEHAWRPSLRWALASSCVSFSGGAFLPSIREFMATSGQGQFRQHDHRYLELMLVKDASPVDLVALAEKLADQEAADEFKEAA